jgi:hypothetical protein
MRLKSLIVLALASVATRVAAQERPSGSAIPIPSLTYIGFNPIGLPFDVGTLEAETGVANSLTLGGVASYIDVSPWRFTTFEAKGRYYPGGVVLRGASIGAAVGWSHISHRVTTNGVVDRPSLSAPTLGILFDYNWILGRDQRLLVGTGVGIKRLLASESSRKDVGLWPAIPTGRLILGFAF